MADDFKALSKTLQESREKEQAEFERQQGLLEKMAADIEATGNKAEDNAKYNKQKAKLDKKMLAFRLKGANSPSARKEIKKEQKKEREKNQGLLGKIAGGIGNIYGDMKDAAKAKIKGGAKGLMTMLKGAAIAGVLVAVMAFLNSEYWTKTKEFIVDKIVPALQTLWNDYIMPIGKVVAEKLIAAWGPMKEFFIDTLVPTLKTLYEDYLKPIAAIFVDYILKTWEDIKVLFTGLKESFALFGEGKWLEGIIKFFGTIGTFLLEQIDAIATGLFNIIATVFGLEETDSVFGSISGFFSDIYNNVVDYISTTWTNIKTAISDAFTGIVDWFVEKWTWAKDVAVGTWTSLKNYMQEIWDGVWGWFTGAWTWTKDVAVGTWTTVTDFITGVWDSVVGWFKGLWSWGKEAGATEEGGFSLTKIVDAAFLKAKEWVISLFKWGTEPVGPEDSWIKKTVHDVINKVKEWAISLFTWANTDEETDPAGFSISGIVKDAIKNVVTWATGLFTWASEAGKVDGEEWSLTTMIMAAFQKVRDWIEGIFSWAKKTGTDEEGEFSLTKLLSGVVTKVVEWFEQLFDIDIGKILTNAMGAIGEAGKKVLGWLGIGDEDKAAMGGPVVGGKPYLVGEQGPEVIIPSGPGQVINAQRTAAMQDAMLRRSTSGVSVGGQPIIAPTTVANTNSTNITNTTTSIVNPDQIISTVNKAA